jgi:formate hydrogenlyase transcriptional activator
VLDPKGGVLYANQTTLDYTGFTAEDVLAPNFRERMFHPEDLKRLRRERKAALEDGLPFEFEQRALRKDGQYRWFLIRYNPFRDEHGNVVRWYVAGTDIDELMRTEEKLREDEQSFSALLTQSHTKSSSRTTAVSRCGRTKRRSNIRA